MDDIAEILKKCGEIRMEIGGHTDSQGREVMNQQLSQSRARAVLNALRERRVLTSALTAKGYGESAPIADNKTRRRARSQPPDRIQADPARADQRTARQALKAWKKAVEAEDAPEAAEQNQEDYAR